MSALVGLLLPAFVTASVVPDGSTPTSVSLDSSNRIVVDIAPADADRISHNRYQSFNVPANGLHINNRTAGARTIINEVTSLETTSFEGELRILGTRAHLIVANPNGIRVNGAEVFNVASMALTTGSVGYQDRVDEFGDSYRNPTIAVSQGEIVIGSEGLSGVINQLELISKSLIIDGFMKNENESAFSTVSMRTGESHTEINSKASVADPANTWVSSTISAANNDGIAVDISSRSSISGSRVSMMVTDAGAGVKIAGNILATANEFTLGSSGVVSVSGDIRAAGRIQINSSGYISRSESGKQNTLESQYSSVLINSTSNIELSGTTVSANQNEDSASLRLVAAGNVLLNTRSENERGILFSFQDIDIQSVNLINQSGRIIANTGITINADVFNNRIAIEDFEERGAVTLEHKDGDRLWYTAFLSKERVHHRKIDFGEPEAGRIASEMLSGSGDIVINTRVYDGYGSNIVANDGNILINSQDFTNEAALVGNAWLTSRCQLGGCDERGGSSVDFVGGNIQASNTLTINSPDSLVNRGGTLQAINDVVLTSDNKVTEGSETYSVYSRTKGLRGLFMRHDAIWVAVDQGGGIISNMGKIVINGSALTVDGGRLDAAQGIEGSYNIVREPTTQDLLLRRRIGMLEGFF